MTQIVEKNIDSTISSSFINYAMSVIISRAIPDLKDGMKPVQRRIIYAMFDSGYLYGRGFFKCARVVGDVMGKYHPHGDSSIYDALVRLAQKWMIREALIISKGNIGSPGSDEPAAMRYTECKLSKLSEFLVDSIHEETVEMQPNYDSKMTEPVVLPAKFPNLLINGSYGVAVGMTTNIPPHNPGDVYNAIKYYIDHHKTLAREQLEMAVISTIKGPDFPNHCIIGSSKSIREMYMSGVGEFTMRGNLEIEEVENSSRIVITSLPYRINIDQFVERLSNIKAEGKLLNDVASIKDATSLKTGVRILISPKRGKSLKSIASQLYLYTQLQTKYHAKFLSIYNNEPKTFSLLEIVERWVEFRIELILKQSQFRLAKVQARLHILTGLMKGVTRIDEIVALIRRSASIEDAKLSLMQMLELDDIQAMAILNMPVKRLTSLEIKALAEEILSYQNREKALLRLIASRSKQEKLLLKEFTEVIAVTDPKRRSIIDEDINKDIDIESTIVNKRLVLVFTRVGYIKLMDIDNYRIQKRGGVGLKYAKLHESDQIRQILTLNNKDWILFFTSSGYVYRCKAYELRESESRNSRGFHVSSIVDLKEGDSIVNISSVPDFQHKHNLIFATKNGIIKKTPLAEYESHAKFLIAINLYEGDKLQSLALCNEDDEILMVTQNGKSKRYLVSSIPKRNRSAIGVIGIKFKDKDSLLSMYSISPHINKGEKQQYVLTVTSEGYVKKTSVYEYPITTSRASMGVTGCNLSEKTGKLIGALVVVNNDILISITNKSDLMRTKICEINPTRRRSSGVQLMKLKRGSHIIDITASDINS